MRLLGRGWELALFAGLMLIGCATTGGLDSPNAGRTLAYQPGLPDFDLEAVATVRDGRAGIDLYLGIPHRSLIFIQQDSARYRAYFETLVRLMDRRGRDLVAEFSATDTVQVAAYDSTQSFRPYLKTQRVPAPPGEFIVEVTLRDGASEAVAVRRQRLTVIDPATPRPVLSSIRLEGQRTPPVFAPFVSLHLPANLDSLRAIVELYNAARLDGVRVAMHLLRFPSDTTVARPPNGLNPIKGSLVYRGVQYENPDTLQTVERSLSDVAQELTVEFGLPPLDEGVYRLVVTAMAPNGNAPSSLHQERDFTVRDPAFPQLTRLDQLVDALTYISRAREMKDLRAAGTPAERKRRFDAFWGSLVANRTMAANLVKRYYERVEEANLFFTSFKEGWKTDRGMVYIILGPPLYVDRRIDAEVWIYDYNTDAQAGNYIFERIPIYGSDGTFDNYVLQRSYERDYHWTRALERWRDGAVL